MMTPDQWKQLAEFAGGGEQVIETWHQHTCDGCGETEYSDTPNRTRAEVRQYLKSRGWAHYAGGLDYCKQCVERGVAARRETNMSA